MTQDYFQQMENVTVETVVIVGCVCASIIAILSIILIVLCCKRHSAKKTFEKMGRLNNQIDMNPLNGSSRILPSSEHRLDMRNSRLVEGAVEDDADVQLQNDVHMTGGPIIMNNPLHRDLPVHSSMLSVDQRPRKILYEVVV